MKKLCTIFTILIFGITVINAQGCLDAALYIENWNMNFFRGGEYSTNNPLNQTWTNPNDNQDFFHFLPFTGVDAAYNNGDGRYIVMHRNDYAAFDINSGQISNGYPLLISEGFPDLPTHFHEHISAAWSIQVGLYNAIYFAKGTEVQWYSNNPITGGPLSYHGSLDYSIVWNAIGGGPDAASHITGTVEVLFVNGDNYAFYNPVDGTLGLSGSLTTDNINFPNTWSCINQVPNGACNINYHIPDDSVTNASSIEIDISNIPGTQLGTDISLANVSMYIQHPRVKDLHITLISPSGVEVLLSWGGVFGWADEGANFGTSCTSLTSFNDQASVPIAEGIAPYVGSFIPLEPLTGFNDNSNPNGTWQIRIYDMNSLNIGDLQSISLSFLPINSNPGPFSNGACNIDFDIADNYCFVPPSFDVSVNTSGSSLGVDVELVSAAIFIEHSYVRDLKLSLVSPSGIEVLLTQFHGLDGDNYGTACNNPTVFHMEGSTSIGNGTAPFTGTFVPDGDFNDFNDGTNPNGNWTIKVCDNEEFDLGTLQFAELTFGMITDSDELISSAKQFSLYPNPNNGHFIIDFEGMDLKEAHLRIKNITGKAVYENQTILNEKQEINLQGLASGIYLVYIQSNDQIMTKKITIQ